MKRLKQTLGTLFILVSVGYVAWTTLPGWFDPDVVIYVDNGSSVPFEVEIDETPAVSVLPNAVGIFEVDAGTRRVVVRQGGETLLDETREFKEKANTAKYVLNPDMSNRYVLEVVRYERRGYESVNSPLRSTDPVGDALGRLHLRAPEPWVVGFYDDVFDEVPPRSVGVKSGELSIITPRQRLCRIAADDYVMLLDATEARAGRPASAQTYLVSDELVAAIERVANGCAQQ